MKTWITSFLIVWLLVTGCSVFKTDRIYETASFQMTIDGRGTIRTLTDRTSGTDYLHKDADASLLSLRIENKILPPKSARFPDDSTIVLEYAADMKAVVRVRCKSTHLTFELMSVTNPEMVELILWGPFPTLIKKTIGETVGVVQGEKFALGIQSLNPRTLGGYPWQENDCMPQIDIFEQDDPTDISEEGKRQVLYRVEAAKPADFGSTLQAYCRNRNKQRIIENWDHEKYTAPAFEDGGVIGSKIALFGCPVEEILNTIGEIEIAEGLPHPMIDGQWGKTAPSASAAYLILDFSEQDIDRALNMTERAGLRYLYHSDAFETWGHFRLKKRCFPDGVESMERCVAKAKDRGIFVGAHTLSNFITPNDPYVTPVPDSRLARVGSSIITEDISPKQTTIPIEAPDFFNQFKNNHLKTVVIGDELIHYDGVSESAPWKLVDCQRGVFGTTASPHQKGDVIGKLADHAYKVFLTDPELSIEVSKNIAELFNKTGLRQISFDGLEGNRSTGMGNYGEILFTKTWYDHLNDEIRHHYIADASRTSHYFWHIYTRMNWGEPWYAGFRESQTEYRLKNQAYFRRNLMPGMLGWFKMTPETSVEDIEWMLARSAAFDAGYAFVTNYRTLEENGKTDEILNLLGRWEKARLSGAFSLEQKQLMEDVNNEFHLETLDDTAWNLYRVYSYKFRHEKKVRQPGESLSSIFAFTNPAEKQPVQFILTAAEGNLDDIKMEIDNHKKVTFPLRLNMGETIKYIGGNNAIVYNKNWRRIKTIPINESACIVSAGEHSLRFDCKFEGAEKPQAKLEVRIIGPAQKVGQR